MTDEPRTGLNKADEDGPQPIPSSPTRELLPLAGVIILGVVGGGHYPPLFLIFAAAFMAASAGLVLLLRWAWALTLAAVFLLACYNLWIFSKQHEPPALVQGLLNLVFFLYMIRPEVRAKLR